MLPLLRVLASEPDALVEHAAAYADLASDELQELQAHWVRRLLWLAVAAVAGLAALLLGGVARRRGLRCRRSKPAASGCCGWCR